MNSKLLLTCSLAAASIAVASAADMRDYNTIRKDLNVMSQVIKGAFQDNDACKGCQVKVATNYLAEQGAVFTVSTYKNSHRYAYTTSDDNSFIINESSIDRSLEMAFEISDIPDIPDMVSNILVGVSETLGEAGNRIELMTDHEWEINTPHIRIDRSSRNAARELAREIRDQHYEIRELEIEILHADNDKARINLERKIEKIETTIASTEEKRDALKEKYDAIKAEYNQTRLAKKEAAQARKEKLLQDVQDIVLQSFCDYGSTLKHIPNNEKISVVFTQRKKNSDRIYVIDKKDITSCDSGEQLKESALSYLF